MRNPCTLELMPLESAHEFITLKMSSENPPCPASHPHGSYGRDRALTGVMDSSEIACSHLGTMSLVLPFALFASTRCTLSAQTGVSSLPTAPCFDLHSFAMLSKGRTIVPGITAVPWALL